MASPDLLAYRVAATQDHVITINQAQRVGLSRDDVKTRARRGSWLRLLRGVYLLDADMYGGVVPRRAWLRAAGLAYPSSVLGTTSAAELLGLDGLGFPEHERCERPSCTSRPCPGRPPELVLPPTAVRAQQRHVRLHFWPLDPEHVTHVDGLALTSAMRTLADLIPRLDRRRALAVLDSALHRGAVEQSDLATARTLAAGRPGCRSVFDLWDMADGGAASPLESIVRLACIEYGVAPTRLQVPVHNRWGDLLGYADLGWERRTNGRSRLLVAECDGADVHGSPSALYRDRRRLNDFTTADCDQLRFTWADALRPSYIASIVRGAL